jgi:hypothetical protein
VTEETATLEHSTDTIEIEKVIIRLAGDSGDGMQLAGWPLHGRFRCLSATT